MSIKSFLEITKKLYELAPWDYLGNEDYCQMFLDDEPQPLLVCVTGSAVSQNFGFIICRDVLQADYFLTLKDKIEECDISAYRRYQHYALFYKRYQDLSEEDRKLFENNEDFQGETFYPVLKHIQWHSPDTSITEEEREALCSILEHLYNLISAIAYGKIKKTNKEFSEVPTRIYNPKKEYYDNLYFPFIEDMFRISPRSVINKEKTEEGFKDLKTNDLVVEYDLVYLPLKQDDNDLLLALSVLWDVNGKQKLDSKLVEIKQPREAAFMNLYLDYIMKFGFFKEVRCRDNIDVKLLISLDIPRRPKYVMSKLENVDQVIQETMNKYY